MEEIQTRDGRIVNASFTDYLIPTALDMPPVVVELVEDPEPDGPYGAKGVGEPPTIVSIAAIVAAVRDATGQAARRESRSAPTTSASSESRDALTPARFSAVVSDRRATLRRSAARSSASKARAPDGLGSALERQHCARRESARVPAAAATR